MADAGWATELHAYYNVKPYWDNELLAMRDSRTSSRSD
jgi:hypothetical protein